MIFKRVIKCCFLYEFPYTIQIDKSLVQLKKYLSLGNPQLTLESIICNILLRPKAIPNLI